jgi:hypothetical protein
LALRPYRIERLNSAGGVAHATGGGVAKDIIK